MTTLTHASTAPRIRATSGKRTGILGWVMSIDAALRQRDSLRRLSDHQLADAGLTRADAEFEAARPVWDAPIQFRLRG